MMNQEQMKEAIQKILRDNTDGNLSSEAFRTMITQQILGILTSAAPKGKLGATVLTESASMYDPKVHGKQGVKPESV